MMTGRVRVASLARNRRHTSSPSVAGSMMSRHDQCGPLARDLLEGTLAGVRLAHRVPFLLEMEANELADVLLVLDHQNRALDAHVNSSVPTPSMVTAWLRRR